MFALTGVHLTPADHNPERAYYFDWHAQIDNPVSVLKGAIAHLQRGYDWNETAANALRDVLSIVVDEWYKCALQ